MKTRYRWLVLGTLLPLGVLGTFVVICCGGGALLFQHGGSPTETYKPTKSPSLAGCPVGLLIVPKSRTQNRRVGPPYDFTLLVNHRIPNLVEWRLISARVERDDGSLISAELRTATGQPSIHDTMVLSGVFREGDWGKRPRLVTQIDLVYPARTEREELTFPLKRHVDRSIYIP